MYTVLIHINTNHIDLKKDTQQRNKNTEVMIKYAYNTRYNIICRLTILNAF